MLLQVHNVNVFLMYALILCHFVGFYLCFYLLTLVLVILLWPVVSYYNVVARGTDAINTHYPIFTQKIHYYYDIVKRHCKDNFSLSLSLLFLSLPSFLSPFLSFLFLSLILKIFFLSLLALPLSPLSLSLPVHRLPDDEFKDYQLEVATPAPPNRPPEPSMTLTPFGKQHSQK